MINLAIDWPSDADRIQITQGLESISSGDATMLLCEFDKSEFSEATKALDSRVCEFVRCAQSMLSLNSI